MFYYLLCHLQIGVSSLLFTADLVTANSHYYCLQTDMCYLCPVIECNLVHLLKAVVLYFIISNFIWYNNSLVDGYLNAIKLHIFDTFI